MAILVLKHIETHGDDWGSPMTSETTPSTPPHPCPWTQRGPGAPARERPPWPRTRDFNGISMGFWWDFNGILMGDEWILIVLLWWNVMDVYLIKMDYFHGILWYNQGYRDLSCQQTWFCGKSPSRGGFNMRTSWFCSKPAILPSGSTSHWFNRQDRGPMTCMTLELLADIANIYIYIILYGRYKYIYSRL
jgi:hypothetical protein